MYIVQILLHSMNPAFTLTDMDYSTYLTAILNYASYKSPGGFFLEGVMNPIFTLFFLRGPEFPNGA